MLSLLPSWIFFEFLAFFLPVLIIPYLQIQQTDVEFQKLY